jgi:glycosyltransferase involved in cell wall biosynthesis
VIEAGACACPVVASRSPGLIESVRDGETGFLVDHGDIDALGKKIITLLTDDALARSMADAGVRWARTFNWDTAAEDTLALIEEIVAGNGRGKHT